MRFLLQKLEEYRGKEAELWLRYEKDFYVASAPARSVQERRVTLARFYALCAASYGEETRRAFGWQERVDRDLPALISRDSFLRSFARGEGLLLSRALAICDRLRESAPHVTSSRITIYHNTQAERYHRVVGSPTTLQAKFSHAARLRYNAEQLYFIQQDLDLIASLQEEALRRYLTMAVLSHGAAYRELEGCVLYLPSLTEGGERVEYRCIQHLIDEGVKTVSLVPQSARAPGIYLCQGTELWPSQRAPLGSILANFATLGPATSTYAHSWRRIHKHLRDLENERLPWVTGHSMGGSLAMQILLHAHELMDRAYAFNPPLASAVDAAFFQTLPVHAQKKLQLHANLDDFAFWRIGEKMFGQVTLWMTTTRYHYYPLTFVDALWIFPAIFKILRNLISASPAHQQVFALHADALSVTLSHQEIECEHQERLHRFDYLHFFPKLYYPVRSFMRWLRHLSGSSLEKELLRNELEILLLHEQELRDSLTPHNFEEKQPQLNALAMQREALLHRL